MNTLTLRDYQAHDEREIRAAYASAVRSLLYVLPCGGGKTVTFCSIAASAERRSKRVLILCHRVELIDQIIATLDQFGVRADVIAAGFTRLRIRGNYPIAVASVQTLIRRLDDYAAPTLIVIDEAHHTCAASWATILAAYPQAKVLGVTASPLRMDGRGLKRHFERMLIGPSVRELTAAGYLSPYKLFAPPTVDTSGLHKRMGDFKTEEAEALLDAPAITGDALAHYRRHAEGTPALIFCTSVAHAHHVAERFQKAGIAALALDGTTDATVRRNAVADFRNGTLRVIAQCDLANEGWDLPGVHCGIFLRPTMSLGLWIQMTGRCSRLAPGKTSAILLDHVGNCLRLGLPDEEREWELTDEKITRKKDQAPSVRFCPRCFAASSSRSASCIECGHIFERQERQALKELAGELKELSAEEIARRKERREQGQTGTLAGLIAFGRRKGYKSPEIWAQHVMAGRRRKSRSA